MHKLPQKKFCDRALKVLNLASPSNIQQLALQSRGAKTFIITCNSIIYSIYVEVYFIIYYIICHTLVISHFIIDSAAGYACKAFKQKLSFSFAPLRPPQHFEMLKNMMVQWKFRYLRWMAALVLWNKCAWPKLYLWEQKLFLPGRRIETTSSDGS